MVICNPRLVFQALSAEDKLTLAKKNQPEEKTCTSKKHFVKPSLENLKAAFMPSFLNKKEE